MTALPEVSKFQIGMKGVLSPVTCGADFTHLTLPVCEQHEDRGGMCVIAHFPSSFLQSYRICPVKQHSIHKMTIRLLTPENLIPSLPACHSARRAFMPEVAESNTDANGFSSSILRPINLSHAELLGRNHLQPPPFHFSRFIPSNIW